MNDLLQEEYHLEIELVPPGCHRRNTAEFAIQHFTAHFSSVFDDTANNFPLTLLSQFSQFLTQTDITVNLLWQSNATPNVLAYTYLTGPFNYNKMLLASMGYAVQVHEKTDKHGMLSYHSGKKLTDMVHFNHKNITNPTVTHTKKIIQAISACANALKDTCSGGTELEIAN